jgi:hypothetical protein
MRFGPVRRSCSCIPCVRSASPYVRLAGVRAAPVAEGFHDWAEGAAFFGEGVFGTRGAFVVEVAGDDAVLFQGFEAGGEGVGADGRERVLEILEAAGALLE